MDTAINPPNRPKDAKSLAPFLALFRVFRWEGHSTMKLLPGRWDLENDSPTKRIEKAESSAEFAPPSLFLRIFRGPSPEFKLWLLFLGVISHV
jgi:hypothetical protein